MWNPSPTFGRRLERLDVRPIRPRRPVLVMSQSAHAGYFSTLWGHYPFVVSHLPVERFGVFRVVR